jgi:hypothetical protein
MLARRDRTVPSHWAHEPPAGDSDRLIGKTNLEVNPNPGRRRAKPSWNDVSGRIGRISEISGGYRAGCSHCARPVGHACNPRITESSQRLERSTLRPYTVSARMTRSCRCPSPVSECRRVSVFGGAGRSHGANDRSEDVSLIVNIRFREGDQK